MTASSRRQRVAIVGGGISGMACSWKLRNHPCTVDIYESSDRLGGHANSMPFTGNGQTVNVDTGFVVMEEATYPQFTAFLQELGVQTIPTDMSFGVSALNGALEWSSVSFMAFVGALANLFSPWFWRLMLDVVYFNLFARDILDQQAPASGVKASARSMQKEVAAIELDLKANRRESIADFLKRQNYSEQFVTYFLIPMVAAPWCIDPDEFAANFPARNLIQFMHSHSILDTVTKTLRWRTFANGSGSYVNEFRRQMPRHHKLHLNTSVKSVTRVGGKAVLGFAGGATETYDHVVLAIHANQAVTLLGQDANILERRVLGAFTTRRNVCYLHSDTSQLPKRHSAHAAWNCSLVGGGDVIHPDQAMENSDKSIAITFDMNKLQSIPFPGEKNSPGRILVSMNPSRVPSSVQSKVVYYHPLISHESLLMTRHLHKINGVGNVCFAGAWMGYGFHEDGFAAGAHAAQIIKDGRDKTAPLDLIQDVYEDVDARGPGVARLLFKSGIEVVQHLLNVQEGLLSTLESLITSTADQGSWTRLVMPNDTHEKSY